MDRTGKNTHDPGPMSRAVMAALEVAAPADRDAGAVALALRYAELIDNAATPLEYVEPLAGLRALVDAYRDPRGAKYLDKIESALSAHSVASDLGPKLLAALAALGMTPAARNTKGGASGEPSRPAAAVALDEFTARRTGQHHA